MKRRCSSYLTSALIILFLRSTTSFTLPNIFNQSALLSPEFPASIDITTSPDPPTRNCIADPAWSQFHHDIAPSCENALLALADDSLIYGSSPGIFTYSPSHSWARFPSAASPLLLPKRYEYKQCVVAIVMMKMFDNAPIQLPEELLPMRGRWSFVDEVKWGEFIEPASYVRATCGNGVG